MPELIIESEPSGAEVIIDDEVVGTTPLTIPIEISLQSFRTECLSGGSVSCSWDTLKTRLEDQTVSRLWWDLTRDERRSVAVKATGNTLCFIIRNWRLGKPNCEGGEGDWLQADCGHNGMVRIWKFGTESPEGYHAYWQDPHTTIEHCYVSDIAYNLPCYSAGVGQPDWGHELATIQIGEDVTDINNWVFFQYNEHDIRPGESWQFPTPSSLIIRPIGKPPIVEMDFASDELTAFRAECLSGGSVSCSWDVLRTKLEDQTVSKLWWEMSREERRSVTIATTKNVMCFYITRFKRGKPDCGGGEGDWLQADCGSNTVIRGWKFGSESPDGYDAYWEHPVTKEEHCFVPDIAYNLPCHDATVSQEHFGHGIAAMQIGEDVTDIKNWVFFQYATYDLQPGDGTQFPTPSTLSIQEFGGTMIVEMSVE